MDPSSFFDQCCAAYERAAARIGGHEVWLRLAERPVRLRFAGRAMQDFVAPSFGHLATTSANAEPAALTVMVWDQVETGEAIPPRPWQPEAEGVLGRVQSYGAPRFGAMVDLGETQVWMHDRERGRAILWVRDAGRLPSWDRIHPLRPLLDDWASHLGMQMVHAGAVGTAHGGVLVVGPGGSGKSTTVLATLAAGGLSAGDDYVMVASGTPPVAYSIYGTMRLFESHRDRFPELMPYPDSTEPAGDGRPKLTSYVCAHQPQAMVARLPIAAIVMPRPAPGRPTRATREPGGKALFALAPSTLKQLDPQNALAFSRMGALCRALPCWSLELGDDIQAVAPILESIIAKGDAA